jgi:hypothetical protein
MPKRSHSTLGFSLYTFVEFLVLFSTTISHVQSIICVIDRCIIHQPSTSVTLTVEAVGPRISLRSLGPSITPHICCSTPMAYVWARPLTTKFNMPPSLASSLRPVTTTFITLASYYIPILSSCNSTTYIMFVILVSFANTCKLEYYLATLIKSYLHIFQDNLFK